MKSIIVIAALPIFASATFHGARNIGPLPCPTKFSICDGNSSIVICDPSIEYRSHENTCADILNVPSAVCVEPTASAASCVAVSTPTTTTTTTTSSTTTTSIPLITGTGTGSGSGPTPSGGLNGTSPGSGPGGNGNGTSPGSGPGGNGNGTNPGSGTPGQPITPTASSNQPGSTGTAVSTGAADALRASWNEMFVVGFAAVVAGGAIVL